MRQMGGFEGGGQGARQRIRREGGKGEAWGKRIRRRGDARRMLRA